MRDGVTPSCRAEAERSREITERIALLKRVLDSSPSDGPDDPLLLYRFLSLIKLAQGNLNNDLSFVRASLQSDTSLHTIVV